MPRGVVVYASNNSRLKNFAFKNIQGVVRGYRALGKLNEPLAATPVAGQPGRMRYQVRLLAGGIQEVDSAAALSKKHPNDAWSPTGGPLPIGSFAWEDVRDAVGTAVLRRDSSGMFAAVASDLRRMWALTPEQVRGFDNVHDDQADGGTSDDSREHFFDTLARVKTTGLDFFAYSGHGTGRSLPSAGITTRHVRQLADEISRLVNTEGHAVLYACSTAAPSGFAQQLSAQLGPRKVWGHTGAGRASKNPNVRMFQNGVDQHFLESNFTKAEKQAWAAHLDQSADFYVRFPFMTVAEMKREMGLTT